jgi:hypothetical protein
MYTLITIFYAALLGMGLMIVLKIREAKTGKPNLISRIGANTDHLFQSVFSACGHAFSYINKHTFKAIAYTAAFHILKYVRSIYVDIKDLFISNPHGKKLIDAVRGRGEVSDHGASFFLRRIAAAEERRK